MDMFSTDGTDFTSSSATDGTVIGEWYQTSNQITHQHGTQQMMQHLKLQNN